MRKVKKYEHTHCSKKQIQKNKELNTFQDKIAEYFYNTKYKKKNKK